MVSELYLLQTTADVQGNGPMLSARSARAAASPTSLLCRL